MKKKTENAGSISKLIHKKGKNSKQKESRKCIFNLKIHAKKDKNAFSISKFIQKKQK